MNFDSREVVTSRASVFKCVWDGSKQRRSVAGLRDDYLLTTHVGYMYTTRTTSTLSSSSGNKDHVVIMMMIALI